jgi:DNA-binding PadR family transcriptional regulator
MAGYEINLFFMKRVGTLIAPGVIYRKLKTTEKKGWTRCVQKKGKCVYSLTEQGQAIADNMNFVTKEIHGCVKVLLGS